MRPTQKGSATPMLTRRALVGLAGAACAAVALGGAGFTRALAVSVTEPCTLAAAVDDAAALEGAEVRVAWYKVADAVKLAGQDAYGFDPVSAFAEAAAALAQPDALDAEGYARMADAATRVVLEADGAVAREALTALGETAEVSAGLYLGLVADGAGKVTAEEVDRDGEAALACVVESATERFSFAPQLVAVPTKEPDAEGNLATSNPGPWSYAATLTLKYEAAPRLASVVVRKVFSSFNEGTTAACVFQVDAYADDTKAELRYSNVVTLVFDEAAAQEAELAEAVPAGSYVEVTEVYAGAGYEAEGTAVQAGYAWADEPFVASFQNRYDRQQVRGGGVNNAFSYDGDRWEWNAGAREGGQ